MPTNRGTHRKDVVHIYSGILLSHKNELNNVICSNMEGPRDYHTKWSKSGKERQIPHDITCMWTLKYDINNLFMKQTYRHRKQAHGYQREKGVGEG